MEIVGDNTCVTSVRHTIKVVYCRGKQRKYWLELQFVDESNNPVSGLNVRLEYHPLASAEQVAMWRKFGGYDFDPTPPPNPPAGVTDSQGLVRFDDLYWQSMDLKTDAQPLGDKLGFNWLAISLSGLPVSLWQKDMALQLSLQLKKDPYWHHGNTVVFFRAQQCLMKPTSPNRKSLVDGEVYSRRFLATKLFLVPSLNEACLKATGEHQAAFIQCLTPANLAKTFPKNTNPPGWPHYRSPQPFNGAPLPALYP